MRDLLCVRPTLSCGVWDLAPWPGMEPPLHWEREALATKTPGVCKPKGVCKKKKQKTTFLTDGKTKAQKDEATSPSKQVTEPEFKIRALDRSGPVPAGWTAEPGSLRVEARGCRLPLTVRTTVLGALAAEGRCVPMTELFRCSASVRCFPHPKAPAVATAGQPGSSSPTHSSSSAGLSFPVSRCLSHSGLLTRVQSLVGLSRQARAPQLSASWWA